MSNIITANVFVTRSREAMERIFFGKNQSTSFSEKMLKLTDEQLEKSFIVSNKSNEVLLKFEMSWGKGADQYAVLKMLETDKLLDLFLTSDPMANMLSDKLNNEKNISEVVSKVESTGLNPPVSDSKKIGDILKNTHKYFLAFGTNDNIKSWAGPYVMHLTEASLTTTSDNSKVITAKFMPTIKTQKLWSKRFEKMFGYTGLVEDYNSFHSRGDFIKKSKPVFTEYDDDPAYFARGSKKGTPDLNRMVRRTVQSYLGGISGKPGNVVVALPINIHVTDKRLNYYYKTSLPKGFTSAYLPGPNSPIIDPVFYTVLNYLGISVSNLKLEAPYQIELSRKDRNKIKEGEKFSPKLVNGYKNIEVTSERGIDPKDNLFLPERSFRLYMGLNAFAGEDIEGSSPLARPLFDFCAGIKSEFPDQSAALEFVLYEETDVRVLKIWEKYGLIADSSEPALVFGGKRVISDLLYLNWYSANDEKKVLAKKWLSSKEDEYKMVEHYLFDARGVNFTKFDAKVTVSQSGQKWTDVNTYTRDTDYDPKSTSKTSSFYNSYAEDFVRDLDLDYSDSTVSKLFDSEEYLGDNAELKKLFKSDLVFKHNTRNSNILKLDYRVDTLAPALMNLNIYPRLDNALKNSLYSTRKVLALQEIEAVIDSTAATKLIEKVEKISSSDLTDQAFIIQLLVGKEEFGLVDLLSDSLKKAKSKEFEKLTTLEVAAFLAFIRQMNRTEKGDDIGLVTSEDRVLTAYTSMYEQIQKLSYLLEIKTLPVFSNKIFMNKSCSVVGFHNHILGSRSKSRLAPYTGSFSVIGWKHTIEPDNINSFVSLVRQGYEAGSIENTSITVKDFVIDDLRSRIKEAEEKIKELKVSPPVPTQIDDLPSQRVYSENRELNRAKNNLTKLREQLARVQK